MRKTVACPEQRFYGVGFGVPTGVDIDRAKMVMLIVSYTPGGWSAMSYELTVERTANGEVVVVQEEPMIAYGE